MVTTAELDALTSAITAMTPTDPRALNRLGKLFDHAEAAVCKNDLRAFNAAIDEALGVVGAPVVPEPSCQPPAP